jgi:hypothetical protein
MEAIEALARAAGLSVYYAAVRGPDVSLRRVGAGEAYRAAHASRLQPGDDRPVDPEALARATGRVLRVECDAAPGSFLARTLGQADVVVCDHHRPGDSGFGRPPAEYLPASAIGQVAAALAERLPWPAAVDCALSVGHPGGWVLVDGDQDYAGLVWVLGRADGSTVVPPNDLLLLAASDHCPAAAYRGRCPGVDPDQLRDWRARTRAAFQRRSMEAVLADVESACAAILEAPGVRLASSRSGHCGCDVRDLRGRYVPELPEASLRLGLPVLVDGLPGPDGRKKVVLVGDEDGDAVRAFLGDWAAGQGLTDLYGDPARGFAGGYLPA